MSGRPSFSNRWLLLINILFLAIISLSCVSPQRFVLKTSNPSQSSGYICGMFSGRAQGFGFGIIEVNSQKEHLMPFFEKHLLNTIQDEKIQVIEVPPGTYRIGYWVTYDAATNFKSTKTNWPNKGKASEFEVKPGKVLFLGRYAVNQARVMYNKIGFEIIPQKIQKDDIVKAFKDSFPNFSLDSVDFRN